MRALAVGFFDGVHLGHRRLLARADAALTFRNHPATVFAPDRAPALLMTPPTRLAAIRAALGGADTAEASVRALDFTAELAAQPPSEFAAWLRMAYPALDTILCGANWTFGAGGAGDAAFLRARGFRVEVVPFAICGETPVSSTRIRAAVASGDLDLAAAMLGRPWTLEGEVFAGKGVGHTLGFPTLNVRPATGLVRPPRGVYAVETAWGRGAANYGLAPTMGARAWAEPVLEVHLLEVPAAGLPPLRGRTVAVDMQRFLRPERHFASVAELQAQIARDLAAARA